MDPPTWHHGYSIQSSDKHKMLLNRLAHKSGLGGELSSAVGISSNEQGALMHNNNRPTIFEGTSEINWSEQPGYQQHFGGIVRVETSP